MYSFTVRTPFGNLGVTAADGVLQGIAIAADAIDIRPASRRDAAIAERIARYCEQPHAPFDLDIELVGTPFQRRVWRALQRIPAGSVLTYGQLADRLSTSARAIGNACRRNPLLLVVPCHRVVAADGVGGFSGARQGRWPAVKRRLLAHEGVVVD